MAMFKTNHTKVISGVVRLFTQKNLNFIFSICAWLMISENISIWVDGLETCRWTEIITWKTFHHSSFKSKSRLIPSPNHCLSNISNEMMVQTRQTKMADGKIGLQKICLGGCTITLQQFQKLVGRY
jgi:hypothetical protein